jgi:integrase
MAGQDEEESKKDSSVADLIRELLADKEKPKPQTSLAEIIRLFLADVEGRVKPKTLRMYRYYLQPFGKRYGKLNASDLTPALAETYARGFDWSDSTRNAFLGTPVTAFRWAVRKARLLPHTPLEGSERPPRTSQGAESLINPEEHAQLMEAANRAFTTFLRVLYATGARPGEVAKITAKNFDQEDGIVSLKEHKAAHKSGKPRIIYLTPEITALLSSLAERFPSGPLLRNTRGKAWSERTLVKAMIATRKRAGIPRVTNYGLGHSFATDALANGVPDAQVAELLGHSGTAMLHKHYSHLTAKTKVLRAALDRVRGEE